MGVWWVGFVRKTRGRKRSWRRNFSAKRCTVIWRPSRNIWRKTRAARSFSWGAARLGWTFTWASWWACCWTRIPKSSASILCWRPTRTAWKIWRASKSGSSSVPRLPTNSTAWQRPFLIYYICWNTNYAVACCVVLSSTFTPLFAMALFPTRACTRSLCPGFFCPLYLPLHVFFIARPFLTFFGASCIYHVYETITVRKTLDIDYSCTFTLWHGWHGDSPAHLQHCSTRIRLVRQYSL